MLVDYEIKDLIEEHDMIENYTDLSIQIQSNGFDLCVDKLFAIKGKGRVTFDNKDRMIGKSAEIPVPDSGKWTLGRGVYKVQIKEITNMPPNVCAIARPRSSVMRNGADVVSGIWDCGYHGKSEVTLVVHTERGFEVTPGARICQLLFFEGLIPKALYDGKFQGENLDG